MCMMRIWFSPAAAGRDSEALYHARQRVTQRIKLLKQQRRAPRGAWLRGWLGAPQPRSE
jgi:hypothetical protein